jgi:hypothetical protein
MFKICILEVFRGTAKVLPAAVSFNMCVLPSSFPSNFKRVPLCMQQGVSFETSLTLFMKMLLRYPVRIMEWFGVSDYWFGMIIKVSDKLQFKVYL